MIRRSLPPLKTFLDTRTPNLARILRRTRDNFRATRFRPEPTGLGFSILRGSEFHNRLEGTELPTFCGCLRKFDLFVDVGANVGFFTLLASRAGVPSVAIEPSPINLRHLYENIRHVQRSAPIEILPVALSDGIGIADLLGSGQGASLRPGWGNITSNYATTVPTTTLDSVVVGRSGRLLIKVDVEGNEDAVMRGATATLERLPRPTFLIEHGPRVEDGYAELFELFWSRGYSVMALPEDGGRSPFLLHAATVASWSRSGLAPELMFMFEPA